MNDFDGQEPGTIESILKFTKETYGANFEIFDKVNFQDRWSFRPNPHEAAKDADRQEDATHFNHIYLDNNGTSSIPIFGSTDKT